jgi:hypothetical protein
LSVERHDGSSNARRRSVAIDAQLIAERQLGRLLALLVAGSGTRSRRRRAAAVTCGRRLLIPRITAGQADRSLLARRREIGTPC